MIKLHPNFRKYLPIILVSITLFLFIYLFVKHPNYRHTLVTTNPWLLVLIAALYAMLILCFNWVYSITLRLCGEQLDFREGVLLTCYSTIVNFFGPLQSGPGVRAAYVKQKKQVRYIDYTFATFVYYAMYAVISALFILIGSGRHWPIASALLVCVSVGCSLILYLFHKRLNRNEKRQSKFHITMGLALLLLGATITQLGVVTAIYFVELRAVHTGASISQAFAYGGAANFSLFVSLTPGAIGFREAFLEFSRQLHHIPTAGILAASVIDRSVYVAFLGILFLLTLSLHFSDRFKKNVEVE